MPSATVPLNMAPSPRATTARRSRFSAARVKQVAGSLASVVAAYWLYWLIAVPLIEPSIEPESPIARTSEDEVRAAREQVSVRNDAVARYFPEGAWERDRPSIWQSDQTQLLFKSLEPMPDGTVELHPCTLLFFPKGQTAESGALPIIMQLPGGWRVKLDKPIARLKT